MRVLRATVYYLAIVLNAGAAWFAIRWTWFDFKQWPSGPEEWGFSLLALVPLSALVALLWRAKEK